ncbi:MAG: colicin E3/pyocin S6 family cytotoxin [Oscillospiraceae bacterium]|nr:colicin E3/pyocin S6 family cytotoxin [Oscillospiraceae bacterium]
MPYIPRPKPCFLDTMVKAFVDGDTQVYKMNDKFYTWDGLHGEIEVFNKRGCQIMIYDANGNLKNKPFKKGRKIDV